MPCDRHTGTQSWQCGSAYPRQEVSPARFWVYSKVSPTIFSGSHPMPSRNTTDTYPDNCHIQGIVRPSLLIFTLGFKESASEVLLTAHEKTNLRPGFQKTKAPRSTDDLQILKHFSITTLQVQLVTWCWHYAKAPNCLRFSSTLCNL